MNFILKIVEGPNKGAEIALVEGVSVTLGKGDECDIVIADPTLPDNPVSILAKTDSVLLDGEPLAPFHVASRGATSFAVGPAAAPWDELKWPKPEDPEDSIESPNNQTAEPPDRQTAEPPNRQTAEPSSRRRGGCFGCLFVLLLILFALALAGWFFRDRLEPYKESVRSFFQSRVRESGSGDAAGEFAPERPVVSALSAVASKYGLSCDEKDGEARMSGNLKTRRERLSATAEAYAAAPGVDLDLSDDESLRLSAEDALFTFTEGRVKVVVATNRCIAVAGVLHTPYELGRMVDGLKSDLPKLSDVDVSGVKLDGIAPAPSASGGAPGVYSAASAPSAPVRTASVPQPVNLPVCGILTSPYPCLVMKNGTRLLPGAAIGENTILEIGADSVVLTNAVGRFEWKP